MYNPTVSNTNIDQLRLMRILLVDSNLPNIIQLRSILEDAGFKNLLVAKDSEEAMQCLRDSVRNEVSNIDLIMLPSSMLDGDVYEFCSNLRNFSEWNYIPAIITTESDGWWQEDVARLAYDAGATDVIFKPVRGMDLIPRISLALTLKQERNLRKRHEEDLGNELAERKVMEARLQYLVGHDDLTGLANRRRLEQALELAVIHAKNFQRTSAMLYLDLDQFKIVNDTEGHDCGDRMLISLANLLRQQIDPSNTLARIGSDEFVVLVENTSAEEATEVAERLRKTIDEFRFESGIRTYHICACVGIALINPAENVSASEILTRADQACHIAKSRGRNIVHTYNNSDSELAYLRQDVYWMPLIRNAIANNKFRFAFQPVVRVSDGQIRHYEALLRMVDEEGELILPDNFIPVAERMGLIHQIDMWVIEHAIDFLESLPPQQSHISLNINISGHAFHDQSLLPLIQKKLEMTWVSAHRLTFEITETAAIANFAETREMVARLRALGCRFALDDFGAGFNSFQYLKNFPVDFLKIDGGFIVNLHNDPVDQVLVKSMIDIAHSLGKKTVAEYIESPQSLALLRNFGVDYMQGNYLGAPETELATTTPFDTLVSPQQKKAASEKKEEQKEQPHKTME